MKKFLLAVLALTLWASFAGLSWAQNRERLNIYTWSDYMDPQVVKDFSRKYNVDVYEDLFESNEEMMAKLQTVGLGQYDIIVPSTYIMPALINLKLIQPLDHAKLTNLKNIDPYFNELDYDPQNEYTIPYQWGLSGLVARPPKGVELEPSWNLIFDPQKSIGGVIMLNTGRDVIGSALKYQGKSLNSTNPAEIKAAAELVLSVKKRATFMGFDGGVSGRSKVLAKVANVANVYNGDGLKAVAEDPELVFLLPREGGEIWIDLVAVPAKAPNYSMAMKWIDYLLEPEVAARLSDHNQYATPVTPAKQFINPDDLNNPLLYPERSQLANFEFIKDLGPDNRLYEEAWAAIKSR